MIQLLLDAGAPARTGNDNTEEADWVHNAIKNFSNTKRERIKPFHCSGKNDQVPAFSLHRNYERKESRKEKSEEWEALNKNSNNIARKQANNTVTP